MMTNAPERVWAIIGYSGHDAQSGRRVVTGEFHTIKGIRHGEEYEYVLVTGNEDLEKQLDDAATLREMQRLQDETKRLLEQLEGRTLFVWVLFGASIFVLLCAIYLM